MEVSRIGCKAFRWSREDAPSPCALEEKWPTLAHAGLIVVASLAALTLSLGGAPQALQSLEPAYSDTRTAQQRIPIPPTFEVVGVAEFIENVGQWDSPASFVFRDGAVGARLERDRIWFDLRNHRNSGGERVLLELAFIDASPATRLEGRDLRATSHNFLLGSEPENWRTGVAGYGAVRWIDVWPGVSVTMEPGQSAAALQYTVSCAPGTGDLPCAFGLKGADQLVVEADGGLVARTVVGELRQSPPRAWGVEPGGATREIASRFVLLGPESFAIHVKGRDESLPLVIDPGLEWAGYIGGSGLDIGTDVRLTSSGESIVVGYTDSWDFPTTPGVIQPGKSVLQDAFAMRISADGTVIDFATYMGGSDLDEARALAIDPSGVIAVVGRTYSADFPLTVGAWDTSLAANDAFVLKLSADGKHLRFSTLVGGSGSDAAWEADLANDGDVIVGISTTSMDLSVGIGAAQPSSGGSWDAFVARVRADCSTLEWATYLGGSTEDFVYALALAADESVLVGGWAQSTDFPVTLGAFDTVYGPHDPAHSSGYVTRVSPDGTSLVFSTFLDGSLSAHVNSLSVNVDGWIAAAGSTNSPNFPTTPDAWDLFTSTDLDGFVTVLTSDGSALVYSTSIGSSSENDGLADVILEDSGAFTVFGSGPSHSFSTTPGAFDSFIGGAPDSFVMRFKPGGSAPLYSSLLGGNPGTDGAAALALDATGRAVLLGGVTVGSFPVTPGSFDPTYAGGPPFAYDEGTLAKLELQPLGVTAFGSPTPACKGAIRLTALGEPKAGSSSFSIACVGAPPGAIGVLAVATAPAPTGFPVLGATIYLDPAQPFVLRSALANSVGYEEVPLPIPTSAAGVLVYTQAVWIDTGGCGGTLAFSASDALSVSIASP